MYSCRECEREINPASEVCPYCGADLTVTEAQTAAAGQPGVAKRAIRWTLLLGGLCAFLWYILFLPLRSGDPRGQAERVAEQSLREVARALATYAQSRDGRFPQSLEDLGGRARQPAQRALSEGYQLQYLPVEPADNAGISRYVLLGQPGNYSYLHYYLDETGVLRATRENRAATAQDPPR